MKSRFALFAMIMLAVANTSHAIILKEQLPIDGTSAWVSDDSGSPIQFVADDFSIGPSGATIGSITWWGAYNGTPDDDFTIRIYGDISGTGNVVKTFEPTSVVRTPTSLVTFAGNAIYEYYFNPTGLVLGTGTWWLEIINSYAGGSWGWQSGASGNSLAYYRLPDSASWTQFEFPIDLAFRLTDTAIPEPTTLALFGLGLAGLGAVRRKKLAA